MDVNMTNEQIEMLTHYMIEEESYRMVPHNNTANTVTQFINGIWDWTFRNGVVANLSEDFDEVAYFEEKKDNEPKIEDIVTFCLPSVDSDKGPSQTCTICFEDDFEKNMIITNCKHCVCIDCMKLHLQSIHDSGNVPCCSVCRTGFMFLEAFDFDKCYELEAILRQ